MVFLRVAVRCQGEYGRPFRVSGRAVPASQRFGTGHSAPSLKHFATSFRSCQRSACPPPIWAMDSTCAPPGAAHRKPAHGVDTHPMQTTKSAALRVRATGGINGQRTCLQRTGAGTGPGCSVAMPSLPSAAQDLPVFFDVRSHCGDMNLAGPRQSVKGHSARWSL